MYLTGQIIDRNVPTMDRKNSCHSKKINIIDKLQNESNNNKNNRNYNKPWNVNSKNDDNRPKTPIDPKSKT